MPAEQDWAEVRRQELGQGADWHLPDWCLNLDEGQQHWVQVVRKRLSKLELGDRDTLGKWRAAHLFALIRGRYSQVRSICLCGVRGWFCGRPWFCHGCSRVVARKLAERVAENTGPGDLFWSVISTQQCFPSDEWVFHGKKSDLRIHWVWSKLCGLVSNAVKEGSVGGAVAILDVAQVIREDSVTLRPHANLVWIPGKQPTRLENLWKDKGLNVKSGVLKAADLQRWLDYSIKPVPDLWANCQSVDPERWQLAVADLEQATSYIRRFRWYGAWR